MSQGFQHLEHERLTTDEWHAHSPAEGEPQVEHGAQANAWGIIAVIASFGVVTLVVAVIVGVYLVSYTSRLRAERQETISARADYSVYRAQTDATFAEFDWINAAEGTVALPIAVAKQKIIEQYQNR